MNADNLVIGREVQNGEYGLLEKGESPLELSAKNSDQVDSTKQGLEYSGECRLDVVSPDWEHHQDKDLDDDSSSEIANRIVRHVLSEAVLLVSDSDSSFSGGQDPVLARQSQDIDLGRHDRDECGAGTDVENRRGKLSECTDLGDTVCQGTGESLAVGMSAISRELPEGEPQPDIDSFLAGCRVDEGSEHDYQTGGDKQLSPQIFKDGRKKFGEHDQDISKYEGRGYGHVSDISDNGGQEHEFGADRKSLQPSLPEFNMGSSHIQNNSHMDIENAPRNSNSSDELPQTEEKTVSLQRDSGIRHEEEQTFADVPKVSDSYEVCRTVEPGLMECLILETGECVRCGSKLDSSGKTIPKCDSLPKIEPKVEDTLANERKPHEPENELQETGEKFSPNSMTFKILQDSESELQNSHRGAFRIVKSPMMENQHTIIYNVMKINSELLKSIDRPGSYNDKNVVAQSQGHDSDMGSGNHKNLQQILAEMELESVHGITPMNDISSNGKTEKENIASESIETLSKPSRKLDDDDVNRAVSRKLASGDFVGKERLTLTSLGSPVVSMAPQASTVVSMVSVENGLRDTLPSQDNPSQSADADSPISSGVSGSQIPKSTVGETLISCTASVPTTGPIPSYKTLQDQQVTWMKMFHNLEEEHKAELKCQYSQHQATIHHMQHQMELELQKQQDLIQQKLDTHRELLLHNASLSSVPSPQRSEVTQPDSGYVGRGTHQYSPNAGNISKNWHKIYQEFRGDETQDSNSNIGSISIRRSLEKDFDQMSGVGESSQARRDHIQRSPLGGRSSVPEIPKEFPSPLFLLNNSSEMFMKSAYHKDVPLGLPTGRELPRAGVYSSPMPMVNGPSASKSGRGAGYVSPVRRSRSEENLLSMITLSEQKQSAGLQRDLEARHQERVKRQGRAETSLTADDSQDVELNTRARVNLREKYSKHLADLRSYYEQEIQELRGSLASLDHTKDQTSTKSLERENSLLRKEIIGLQDKCGDCEEELDLSLKNVRELEQKLYGVEFRAREYCEHLAESQTTVNTLRRHVEDLQSYCRERDDIIQDMDQKVRQQSDTLKQVYKSLDEQTEMAKSKNHALQRIVEKYEAMEREHNLLKDTLNNIENKLYDVRSENVDLNSFEHSSPYSKPAQNNIPPDLSYISPTKQTFDGSFTEYTDEPNIPTSPVVKAERELYKLRDMMRDAVSLKKNSEPKLQKKFYGADTSLTERRGSSTKNSERIRLKKDRNRDSPPSKSQTKAKFVNKTDNQLSNESRRTLLKPKFLPKPEQFSSPTRFDISHSDRAQGSVADLAGHRDRCTQTPAKQPPDGSPQDKTDNLKLNPAVENMLDKIKSGRIVSRSSWEDINMSMSKPKEARTSPLQAKRHEDQIRDRLKNIEDVEHRYDDLQAEKRQLESVLSKIPVSGRVDRKSRKQREEIEDRLDKLQQELGSVRMSLKKYNVLKTSS
ncbi:hypothetical protein ScPMuIL_006300 [Solemya velum]